MRRRPWFTATDVVSLCCSTRSAPLELAVELERTHWMSRPLRQSSATPPTLPATARRLTRGLWASSVEVRIVCACGLLNQSCF